MVILEGKKNSTDMILRILDMHFQASGLSKTNNLEFAFAFI